MRTLADGRKLALTNSRSLRVALVGKPLLSSPRLGRVVWPMIVGGPMIVGAVVGLGSILHQFGSGWLASLACAFFQIGPLFAIAGQRTLERLSIRLAVRRARRFDGYTRITGEIEPGPTFRAAVTQRPAVMARYLGGAQQPWDESRAVDFSVVTDEGRRVLVSVSNAAFLDDRPPRPGRRELGECSIGPGDRVEIAGLEVHEVDAGADRQGLRDVPMQTKFCGADLAPLVVRPLTRKDPVPRSALCSPFWEMG